MSSIRINNAEKQMQYNGLNLTLTSKCFRKGGSGYAIEAGTLECLQENMMGKRTNGRVQRSNMGKTYLILTSELIQLNPKFTN